MPLKAVIFDLDDTLLDTSALLDARDRRAWAEVYAGLDLARVFPVSDAEGSVEGLPEEVRGRGLKVGLYTHSPERYATELLRAHGMRVDAMVTGSDRLPPKPDPTGLLAVARELGVAPSECMYVGDSVGDFGAAAAAGMQSVGVSWTRNTPRSWRHGWPDVAVDRPSRLLELIDGEAGLGPLGEQRAAGVDPTMHFGSVMRLGGASYGLGRYFPMGDIRYPKHALSHLVLDSKNDPDASEELAQVFGALAQASMRNPPQLVVSVPPAPDDARDRFEPARAVLAEAFGARDGGGVLQQLYSVEDYKSTPRDARAGAVVGRFEATERFEGKRAVLLDDVLTSGAQSEACRAALQDAGCSGVTVIVASVTQDALQEPCPRCGADYGGRVRTRRRRRDGKEFLACSRYPNCYWTSDLPA